MYYYIIELWWPYGHNRDTGLWYSWMYFLFSKLEYIEFKSKESWLVSWSLVTQPMMQSWPNQTELRLMDSYIQILCIFQKSKQKVPPPLLLTLYQKRMIFSHPKEWFSSYSVLFGLHCIIDWVTSEV
jgi:hypothetical protein